MISNKSFFCYQKVERPILRWDPGGARDRSAGALDRYFSIWNSLSSKRDFIQFRKYTGRSGSKKVRFFLHRCSRKIGISTGIEVVLGALFNCGYDACFLMSFFFFLVNCRYKSNGPKNVTFQFFVGPFLMISKSTFWCLQ